LVGAGPPSSDQADCSPELTAAATPSPSPTVVTSSGPSFIKRFFANPIVHGVETVGSTFKSTLGELAPSVKGWVDWLDQGLGQLEYYIQEFVDALNGLLTDAAAGAAVPCGPD
jgi:hypothetical protein